LTNLGAPFLLHETLGCPIANLHSARSDLMKKDSDAASKKRLASLKTDAENQGNGAQRSDDF
jgi:hypothetical protein